MQVHVLEWENPCLVRGPRRVAVMASVELGFVAGGCNRCRVPCAVYAVHAAHAMILTHTFTGAARRRTLTLPRTASCLPMDAARLWL